MTSLVAPVPSSPSAASTGAPTHPWMLVAPWWHWPTQTGHGRTSHPALQKYETPDVVNTFLSDPQLRLEFQSDVDQVFTVSSTTGMSAPTRTATGIRKLFLDTHRRFYLITCELHCDATGFPPVTRDQVCQAGFVIRRRVVDIPAEERTNARRLVRRLAAARQRLGSIETELATARQRTPSPLRETKISARRDAAMNLVAQRQDDVRAWAAEMGVRRSLQGWIPQGLDTSGDYVDLPPCPTGTAATPAPTPLSGVGTWEDIEELPTELSEDSFPLRPLIADPTDPTSDAAGATIYYGLVPTGSSDVDPSGTARFDDDSIYEIRCFVRRHKPVCPRTGPQCHCPIVWSDPTGSYQIAPHFDLQGTSNRPVTVQMPDLNQLKSNVMSGQASTGLNLKSPQGLNISSSGFPPGGSTGGAEICSFAIPLLTIVATFVFKLFLPIVVLAFQLWFLLALKFCIPPEVSVQAGLSAALSATPPTAAGWASLSASFQADIEGDVSSLFGGSPDGDTAVSALESSPGDLVSLAKLLFATSPPPWRPPDLVFAPHVDRSTVQP